MIPSSLEVEQAILYAPESLTQLTGYAIPATWPGTDWLEVLPMLLEEYQQHPEWCAWNWLIVHTADSTLIGSIGTIFPPNDQGMVTIGFYQVPEYRRQGYMREAAHAYITWLRHHPQVRSITADCIEQNIASQRILIGLGMRENRRFTDEEGAKINWHMSA